MELSPTQDGFLGEIAKDFTFATVARLAGGVAARLAEEGLRRVVVAHDTRFLAKEMAEEAARVLAGAGLETHLLQGPAPFPLFAFALAEKEAAGFYLTASRKPAPYQGVKLRRGPGKPLSPEELSLPPSPPEGRGSFALLDLKKPYLERLAQSAGEMGEKGGVVYLDAMGGAGGGFLAGAFKRLGLGAELREIHPLPHPLFYGVDPNPVPENLNTLRVLLKALEPPGVGFALDGDADRLAVFLPGGEMLPSEGVLAHLREASAGREVQGDGEGGYLFPWHLPEKDAFLAALLLLKVLL
ncbi:Phosphoglucomutase/phosphomannomutase alpha/beta/alpha domain II [Thermus sp. CCB_US3_UF1]|uniref:phosphoglucomutase n=1 Tax=Thermus sp. CCB_US3_UF1 TaxID=1111069 RepID=UPI0002389430|nr:phosphoglucomutase [Thermus sp. CCB_US3_UF1]AEV16745.1 Phosphoglucomutase/phosphomannomutase alpha/beta/alpha domain II [Thermus sp. CCB_US3_UF1]